MNLMQRKCQMDCVLTLTERETEMLGYLAGYGPKSLAELISKQLTTRYEVEEWEQFWQAMRHELENASARFAATIRRVTIEEVAQFVETHWCENDVQNNYKVHERKPHPNEPLAKAIRGLKERKP